VVQVEANDRESIHLCPAGGRQSIYRLKPRWTAQSSTTSRRNRTQCRNICFICLHVVANTSSHPRRPPVAAFEQQNIFIRKQWWEHENRHTDVKDVRCQRCKMSAARTRPFNRGRVGTNAARFRVNWCTCYILCCGVARHTGLHAHLALIVPRPAWPYLRW
jgi:hypothetical protein